MSAPPPSSSLPPSVDAANASKSTLLKGLALAMCVASVILLTTILPAEYGIDPTGIGKLLGIKNLSYRPAVAASAKPAETPKLAAPNPVAAGATTAALTTAATAKSKQNDTYRTDTREILLQPNQGLEVKTTMNKGAALIYAWKTKDGTKITHDFHGEPVNAKNNEFESYLDEKNVSESKGSVIAPFTGTHGWYWHNPSKQTVTVMLQASGFYSDMVNK